MDALMLADVGTFERVEVPEPEPGAGDLLIDVAAMSICGSDLMGFKGLHPRIAPPSVIGHEFCGTVREVGNDVDGFAVGDLVAVDPTFGCGTCRYCVAGYHNICADYVVMGEHVRFPGAMAGRVAVPADHAFSLPEGISARHGALVQPMAISYHAAVHRGEPSASDVVFIAGGGAIGIGILMACKAIGVTCVLSDPVGFRRELATSYGADVVVDPFNQDLAAIAKEVTDGYGFDVSFEAVGGTSDALLLDTIDMTANGGRVVVVGLKTPRAQIPMQSVKFNEKTITGSAAHPFSFEPVIERIADGTYDVEPLATHDFTFDQVDDAFALLSGDRETVAKIILTPS